MLRPPNLHRQRQKTQVRLAGQQTKTPQNQEIPKSQILLSEYDFYDGTYARVDGSGCAE